MTIRRYKNWYIATVGGLTACDHDRLKAVSLLLAMLAEQLKAIHPAPV